MMKLILISNFLLAISKDVIRVHYAGKPALENEYKAALTTSFKDAGLQNVIISSETNPTDPSIIDYIVYARNGSLRDFSPYKNAKAVLCLFAGVEDVVNNESLPNSIPLCRMVDPGLRDGMVEYVVGNTLRYHLKTDELWDKKRERLWMPNAPSLAKDKTVGMLGLGELGLACGKALATLNFRVLGWSRRPKESLKDIECHNGKEGLECVLRESDVLVLLLPATPDTEGLINSKTLSSCKPGVYLINGGRGSVIDDNALLDALDSNIVAGATLDVFRVEPLSDDHPFWTHPKVLITPHIAAKTRSETASVVIAENICRSENGQPLLFVADRNAGY